MVNAQEFAEAAIPEAAQRLWTSALQLRGHEFCFILNESVRGDFDDLADHVAVPLTSSHPSIPFSTA
jgi:hypothetical protein